MRNIPISALVSGVINMFALIGIIISVVVWKLGEKSKKAACSVYMISLAFCDMFAVFNDCVLIILGAEILARGQRYSILNMNEFSCKFILYSVMVAPQISAWITVSIAFERMLYVSFPIQMYQSDAKRRCIFVSCVLVLLSLALNILEIIVPKLNYIKYNNETVSVCTGSKEVDIIRSISYGFFTALLPLISLIICNAVILIKLCTRNDDVMSIVPTGPNVRSITKIVVSVSVLHCISTSPIAIYVICQRILQLPMDEHLLTIFAGFYNMNNRVNFVLYYLLGTDFREDLKKLFGQLYYYCWPKRWRKSAEAVPESRRY